MNKTLITLIASLMLANTTVYGDIKGLETLKLNDIPLNEINMDHPFKNPGMIAFEKKVQLDAEEMKIKKEEELKKELEKKELERKNNVKFNSYDVTEISGITYDEMREVLSESHYSNFADISDAFVEAERKYNINAFFLVAIAGLESGWNTSERANNGRNNIVGMAVYNNYSRGTVYESKYHCIMDLASQLRTYYLTPGAEHYNGTSTGQINKKYSEVKHWYETVDKIGDELVAIYNDKFRNGNAY